jgi:DNA-binding NarL/FixJ family response regulator
MPITVLIVCFVRFYREGLRRGLEQHTSIEVTGTANTPDEALLLAETLQPEVVLLDMGIPRAFELIWDIRARATKVKVVTLGISEEPQFVLECVEAGAAGYVAQDASLEELIAAVHAVARGEALCSPRIAGLLFQRVTALAGERAPQADLSLLTQRERETLSLIEYGLSNKEIARRLRIRLATVKNHVHHILEKLGVSRRGAAAAVIRHVGSKGPVSGGD